MKEKPIIAVPLGDPAGVGPEIILRAFAEEAVYKNARPFAVGSVEVLKRAMRFPHMPQLALHPITDPSVCDFCPGVVNVLEIPCVSTKDFRMGAVSAACGQTAYDCIAKSIELALAGKADAVSTPPINKEALHAAGVPYIGHTEIFGALTGTKDPLTIFALRDTLVFFLTRHMSLRDACDAITQEKIIDYVRRAFAVMKQLGVQEPTMAIAGLNPHCGEHGLFGREEVESITPAAERLREMGFPIYGPIGADSVFYQAFTGRYASVLSLTHDQGHIATKSVDFYRTISVTGGMPILRTSVDHGTAFDIAGKGLANGAGLEEAILVAAKYAPAFSRRS